MDLFNHKKTQGLGAIAKLLMIYLTTPHQAGISCKSITQMRNGIDVRLPVSVVRDALVELVDAGVVQWDEDFEVAWVVEAFDEQVCRVHDRHPLMAKGVMTHLDTLPPTSLVRVFLERYGAWLRRSGVQLAGDPPALRVIEPVEAKSSEPEECEEDAIPVFGGGGDAPNHSGNPLPNPFGKGSRNPSSNPSRNQIQVQIQEQVQTQGDRETGNLGSSRQERAANDSPRPPGAPPGPEPEYAAVERRLIAAFEAATASPATSDMVREAMDVWAEGKATEADLVRVVDWWKNNRAEARCYLRQCFQRFGNGAQWSRMATLVLGRDPPSRGGGGRGGGSQGRKRSPGIDETREAVRRHRERKKSTAT